MAKNKILGILLTLLNLFQISQQKDPKLQKLAPLASNIGTVSGFSSGGAIAFQLYLSHSSDLRGCAIFAGLPYECGEGTPLEVTRLLQCSLGLSSYKDVVKRIEKRVTQGLFDPLSNIALQKQFVSHGKPDPLVNIENGKTIYKFFKSQGNSSVYFNETQAGHGVPTVNCGPPCGQILPFATDGCLSCGNSGAFNSLNYIYGGGLKPPVNDSLNTCSPANNSFTSLYSFDQTEFFPPGISQATLNMASTGFIYIPPSCRPDASGCTLLVHIHGCSQEAGDSGVGLAYIKCSGVMAVAEANNIIVIFPQATMGYTSISAYLECWDFVGYTGPLYGTKKGPQIMTIRAMMERVLGISDNNSTQSTSPSTTKHSHLNNLYWH